MGEHDVARIDPSALRELTRRHRSVADLLTGAVVPLMRWSFGAGGAGRNHGAQGQAVRLALEDRTDQIRAWSRAAAETTAALQVSADHYAMAEAAAAARIG